MVRPMLRRATVMLGVTTAGLMAMAAVASCGARTGLPELPEADAGMDVNLIHDHFVLPDMGSEETLPGIDASHDVHVINPCPDAAATLIYLMGISNDLYSFDPHPPAFATTKIGTLDCPEAIGTPFSMAVDREGVAYVVFSSTPTGT